MKATAVWANDNCVSNPLYIDLIRKFLSLEMLCPYSVKFKYSDIGRLSFVSEPSAMHWSRKFEYSWAAINAELNKDCFCLDTGSASAVFKYYLASRVKHVVCQDIDPVSLDLVAMTDIFRSYDNINMQVSDIGDLNPEEYDRSFCLSVLEHTVDPFQKFTKIVDSVKKGGIALISMDVADKVTEDCSIDINIAQKMCESVGIGLPEAKPKDTVAYFGNHTRRCLCIKVKK